MKTRTEISIDPELKKKAQEAQLNISGVAEKAIRDKLGKTLVEIEEGLKCHVCKREGIRETAGTVNTDPHALTWLWPDERWICNLCLKDKFKGVLIGIASRT